MAASLSLAGLALILLVQALPQSLASAEELEPSADPIAETRVLAGLADDGQTGCEVEPTPSPTPVPSPTPTLSPTPSPSPTPTPAPTTPPTWGPAPGPRLGSPEIFGYLPYWDLDAQIDYGAITTLAYFGLAAGADGRLVRQTANGKLTTEYSRWHSAKVKNAIDQAHANGVKFVLTVERMAWDAGSKQITRSLLGSLDARTRLVGEIVAELALRNLDGVSLDFEPILTDQRENFRAFLGELRAALYVANPAYQITFAATGSQPGQTYQMIGDVTASGAADAVIIMGYPLRAIDARYAGGLAPMYSPTSYDLTQITNAYLARVAPDKVVMALPWYGRQWPTVSDSVNAAVQQDRSLYDRPRNIGYADALELAAQYGRTVDPVEMSALTSFRWRLRPGCPETWKQVYYDDVETLGFKYDWVASRGLAGIGIWALGYDEDRPEMWKLLRVKYRGLVDAAPPAGSVAVAADETMCRDQRVRLSLTADDGPEGSGAVYARLSNVADIGPDGLLVRGRTYPAVAEIDWALDDAAVGGSATLGDRTVYAQWRDVSGNWSVPASANMNLDLPSTVDFAVAGGAAAVANPTVSVVANVTGGRSINSVRLSNSPQVVDGLLASGVTVAAAGPASFSVIDAATGGTDVDGSHTVYGQWQDSAGCWSAPVARTVILDRQAPSGTIGLEGSPAFSSGSVAVLAAATDVGSSVATIELSNDGTSWQGFAATGPAITWSAGTTADGPWTIRARWTDAAGNVSAPASATVVLDRQGPAFSSSPVVKPLAGAQLGASSVPATIVWQATDSGSGVRDALVESQGNTGPWTSVPPAPNTGTSAMLALDRSSVWRLRVTSTDRAGNASAPANVGPITTVIAEEGSAQVSYTGKWKRASSAAASGGSIRYAAAKGATATLTFTGRAVAWVAPVAPKLGKAKVFVDGALVATIDLKSSTAQARRILFSTGWATAGQHTIKIKVVATSGRPRVNLDCFVILT